MKSHDLAKGSNDLALKSHDLAKGSDDLALKSHDLAKGSHDLAKGSHDLAEGSHDLAGKSQLTILSWIHSLWLYGRNPPRSKVNWLDSTCRISLSTTDNITVYACVCALIIIIK